MEIEISFSGTYTDGRRFSGSYDDIQSAIAELEMIEVNDEVDLDTPPKD